MSCKDEVSLLRETDLSALDMQSKPLQRWILREWVIALNRPDTSAIRSGNATTPAQGITSSTVTASGTAETAAEKIQSNKDLELVQDEVTTELAAEDEAEAEDEDDEEEDEELGDDEENENDGSSGDSSDADVRVIGEKISQYNKRDV